MMGPTVGAAKPYGHQASSEVEDAVSVLRGILFSSSRTFCFFAYLLGPIIKPQLNTCFACLF